jgi:hypothetical protein
MNLHEFIDVLEHHPTASLQISLPGGGHVPSHFHITEVGHVRKDFIDCGGTVRSSSRCVLQVWVANDTDHRLDAAKLLKIVRLGAKVLPSNDLPVEFEYESGVISQYPLVELEVSPTEIVFHVGAKHTACLAPELCLVQTGSCCGDTDCC